MTEEAGQFLPPPFLYKKAPFETPDKEPWKNDKLGRKEHADKLYSYIEHVAQPLVMTLSAKYGMGKTTFLKCWEKDLENKGIKSIMFNAWESDYSQDAFAAFVAEVHRQLPSEGEAKAKFFAAAKSLGGALLKNAPGFIAKVVARQAIGEVGVKALENFELGEGDAVSLAESIAADSFKTQQTTKDSIKDFGKAFADVIKTECDGKLIVFVDELDRCRPTYAVEVLERIKHIFSVQGVIFVLAVDQSQLVNSISGVYGPKLDSDGYLKKFIDWKYELPEPERYKYIRHLFYDVFEFDKQGFFTASSAYQNGATMFLQLVTLFSYADKISLRDLGRFFTYLNLIYQSANSPFSIELAVVCYFKSVRQMDLTELMGQPANSEASKLFVESEILKLNGVDDYVWNQLSVMKDEVASWLILLFSTGASVNNQARVCVNKGFLQKTFIDESLSYQSVFEFLSSGSDRNSRSIRRGWKTLSGMDL